MRQNFIGNSLFAAFSEFTGRIAYTYLGALKLTMYVVHTTRWMAGLGQAVIIVSYGMEKSLRFAEYQILFPHTKHARFSKRFRLDLPDTVVLERTLSFAREHLEVEADQAHRRLFPRGHFAPKIEIFEAKQSEITQLWLAGLCTDDVREIARDTWDTHLQRFLEGVQQFPVFKRVATEAAAIGQQC